MNGGGLLVNRLEIMERHWYNHNRDPYKNQNLFKDQLQRVATVEPFVLSQAVDLLSGEDVFPKIKKLLYHCLVLSPKKEPGSVDCRTCGSMGLVLGVVFVKDQLRMDIISYEHTPRSDGNYTTRVIGRCSCENGLAYQFCKNAMGKVVEPDQYLVKAAEASGTDAAFEAQVAAQYFRDKAIGVNRGSLPTGPLANNINKLLGEV